MPPPQQSKSGGQQQQQQQQQDAVSKSGQKFKKDDRKKIEQVRSLLGESSKDWDDEDVFQALHDLQQSVQEAAEHLKHHKRSEVRWGTKVKSRPNAGEKRPQQQPQDRSRDTRERRLYQGDQRPTYKSPQRAPRSAPADPDEYVLQLDVPRDRYGAVVGTAGTTLRDIRSKFNVTLYVPGRTEPGHVVIRGKKESCEAAHIKINEILSMKVPTAEQAQQSRPPAQGQQPGPPALGGGVAGGRVKYSKPTPVIGSHLPVGPTFLEAARTQAQDGSVTPPQNSPARGVVSRSPGRERQDRLAAAATQGQMDTPAPAPPRPQPNGVAAKSAREPEQGRDQDPPLSNGTRVRMRMKPYQAWAVGTVTGYDPKTCKYQVQAAGHGVSVPYDYVEPLGDDGDAAAEPSPPAQPSEPTEAEKLRGAYDAIDIRRSNAATVDDFLDALRRHNINVPEDQARKIFDKASCGTGVLSHKDFAGNFDVLPGFLGALYSRSRAATGRDGLQDQAARQKLESLTAAQVAAQRRRIDAQTDYEAQRARVAEQENRVRQAAEQEQRQHQFLANAQQEIDRHQSQQQKLQQEAEVAKRSMKDAQASKRAAEASVKSHEARMRKLSDETQKAVSRLRELEEMVRVQRAEVERLRARDDDHVGMLDQEREKARRAVAEEERLQQIMRAADSQVASAESETRKWQERTRELQAGIQRAVEERKRQEAEVQAEQRELINREQTLQSLNEQENEARKQVEEQGDRVRELEEAAKRREDERRQMEDTENEDLCTEVAIHLARHELAQKEADLAARRRARGV